MGKAGKPLNNLIETAVQMFFRIVAIVMWAAPIGAFGAIAFTVGKFGAGSLFSLGKLLISFYVTCLIFIFAVLWPIAHWCGVRLFRFIRYIREELLIVIATTSSETVLPRMIAKLEALGCEESVVGLVIPTGYSFNLDGTCLYLATAAVFLAQATDAPLGLGQQIGLLAVLLLASKGAAGVAGAAFVVLAATLGDRGHDSGRKRRTRSRRASPDVAGTDADQPDRQRHRDAGGREMGAGARRSGWRPGLPAMQRSCLNCGD